MHVFMQEVTNKELFPRISDSSVNLSKISHKLLNCQINFITKLIATKEQFSTPQQMEGLVPVVC